MYCLLLTLRHIQIQLSFVDLRWAQLYDSLVYIILFTTFLKLFETIYITLETIHSTFDIIHNIFETIYNTFETIDSIIDSHT